MFPSACTSSEGIPISRTPKAKTVMMPGFVRFRDYLFGDIDRTAHQQEFLVALADELTTQDYTQTTRFG